MFLARVIGSVVSTKKDEAMKGRKLIVLRPLLVDEANPTQFRPGANTVVAVDTLGAGLDEVVLFCQGSSARQATGMKSLPIDAAVVGHVDSVEVLGKRLV
jgi:ethanolamine utilization protein EutN